MCEFTEKKQTVHVCGLWYLHGSKGRCAVDQRNADLWLGREAELAHEVCHAHSLLGMWVGKLRHVRWKRKKRTHVNTTLDVELDTAFKAVTGVRRIVEIFIVTAETEPSLRVPSSRGLFKVAEGDAGVLLHVIGVCARRTESGPKIDRFRSKDGDRIWMLCGGDLKDERKSDLDETQQLWVLDCGGSDGRGIA